MLWRYISGCGWILQASRHRDDSEMVPGTSWLFLEITVFFADFKMLSAHDSSIRRGSSADGRHEQLLLLKWSFLLSFKKDVPQFVTYIVGSFVVWSTHTSQTHTALCCGMLCYLFALRYHLAVLIYPFLRNHAHLEARDRWAGTLPSPGRVWKLVTRVWCLDKQKASWLKWVRVVFCISQLEGTMKPVLRIIHGVTPAQTPRREPYVFDEPTVLRIKASLQLRPFLSTGCG